jgi:hypothetical protein
MNSNTKHTIDLFFTALRCLGDVRSSDGKGFIIIAFLSVLVPILESVGFASLGIMISIVLGMGEDLPFPAWVPELGENTLLVMLTITSSICVIVAAFLRRYMNQFATRTAMLLQQNYVVNLMGQFWSPYFELSGDPAVSQKKVLNCCRRFGLYSKSVLQAFSAFVSLVYYLIAVLWIEPLLSGITIPFFVFATLYQLRSTVSIKTRMDNFEKAMPDSRRLQFSLMKSLSNNFDASIGLSRFLRKNLTNNAFSEGLEATRQRLDTPNNPQLVSTILFVVSSLSLFWVLRVFVEDVSTAWTELIVVFLLIQKVLQNIGLLLTNGGSMALHTAKVQMIYDALKWPKKGPLAIQDKEENQAGITFVIKSGFRLVGEEGRLSYALSPWSLTRTSLPNIISGLTIPAETVGKVLRIGVIVENSQRKDTRIPFKRLQKLFEEKSTDVILVNQDSIESFPDNWQNQIPLGVRCFVIDSGSTYLNEEFSELTVVVGPPSCAPRTTELDRSSLVDIQKYWEKNRLGIELTSIDEDFKE